MNAGTRFVADLKVGDEVFVSVGDFNRLVKGRVSRLLKVSLEVQTVNASARYGFDRRAISGRGFLVEVTPESTERFRRQCAVERLRDALNAAAPKTRYGGVSDAPHLTVEEIDFVTAALRTLVEKP